MITKVQGLNYFQTLCACCGRQVSRAYFYSNGDYLGPGCAGAVDQARRLMIMGDTFDVFEDPRKQAYVDRAMSV